MTKISNNTYNFKKGICLLNIRFKRNLIHNHIKNNEYKLKKYKKKTLADMRKITIRELPDDILQKIMVIHKSKYIKNEKVRLRRMETPAFCQMLSGHLKFIMTKKKRICYNHRNMEHYTKLLDNNIIFNDTRMVRVVSERLKKDDKDYYRARLLISRLQYELDSVFPDITIYSSIGKLKSLAKALNLRGRTTYSNKNRVKLFKYIKSGFQLLESEQVRYDNDWEGSFY